MIGLLTNKYLVWIENSLFLILLFLNGYFFPYESVLSASLRITGILVVQAFLGLISLSREISYKKKVWNILYNVLNSLFAYSIGYTIPLMDSLSRNNFAIVMIPLLIVFSYVISDKANRESLDETSDIIEEERKEKSNKPVIEFEDKKYVFSLNSLVIFAIGAPLMGFLTYLFFDTEANYWLHELVIKQTVYFLNLFFNMGATATYNPVGTHHWSFTDLGRPAIFFETFCTGIQAINIFVGVIICTPHSKDRNTNKDILWRKAKSLIVSSAIFYVVNIIRMLIQIYLYYVGYPWESIHVSISAASSFIAAIIVLLLHKWIPEFIISIIYIGTLISKKFKSLRKSEKSK